MRLIEKYLFRQMLWPTVAATLALTAVMMLSETLAQLDVLVKPASAGRGVPEAGGAQPASGLRADSADRPVRRRPDHLESATYRAGDRGLFRRRHEPLAGVCLRRSGLATMCAILSLVINLWVAPWCYRETRDELFKIKTDLVSSLIRDGQFTQPAPGLTRLRAEHRPARTFAQRLHQSGEDWRQAHHLGGQDRPDRQTRGAAGLDPAPGIEPAIQCSGRFDLHHLRGVRAGPDSLPEHGGGGSLQELRPVSARTPVSRPDPGTGPARPEEIPGGSPLAPRDPPSTTLP